VRFATRFAPADYPTGTLDWLKARLALDIRRLAQELQDGRKFILDDAPSIADFSLCAYLFWADQAQLAVPAEVAAWLERIRQLPGWQAPYPMMRGQP
jgi:glutathione S-transferase